MYEEDSADVADLLDGLAIFILPLSGSLSRMPGRVLPKPVGSEVISLSALLGSMGNNSTDEEGIDAAETEIDEEPEAGLGPGADDEEDEESESAESAEEN